MILPFTLPDKPIILASASPRRAEILRKLGLTFTVQPSAVEENNSTARTPAAHALDLARRKAWAVAANVNKGICIGADTIVVLGEEIIGKPASEDEACEMLRQLSGKTHRVFTGFAIIDRPSNREATGVEMTEVTFRELEEAEIRAYVHSGEAMDKAGAYGIQDASAVFAERINGCFYNVVGFPLTRFYLTLRSFYAHEGKGGL
ncbi:MAG: Maf family protein [candidate division KSB1 bacterium]|nr:Maf family protein [candidate division KSB1 bacterium]MDZ7305266.1 Maf family protein [candidate division KSB1 bacterium]MDZ7312051.1 Maf family protein [candidate division KSB1 bacterium]